MFAATGKFCALGSSSLSRITDQRSQPRAITLRAWSRAQGGVWKRMRWVAVISLLALCGCTQVQLQKHTVRQGATLPDVQYQQVLDNLAMFAGDPNALAWHVKVTGGLVQVADQGNAAVVPSAVTSPFLAPNAGLSRNVLGQWNVDAVTESDDLELLQLAYQKAVNPLDANFEIKKAAFEKICELASTFHIALSEEVADEMIETFQIGATAPRAQKLSVVKARLAPLYRRIEELQASGVAYDPRAAAGTMQPPGMAEIIATKREIVQLIGSLCHQPFLMAGAFDKPMRGPVTTEQAEDKISALVELVSGRGDEPNKFAIPWLGHGCKWDLPACACYKGHYRGCQGDCYAWVMPEQMKTLRDFTLLILALVPPDAQEASLPRLGVGAAFSPNSS